ncbi:MAG TPA: hypothetical protein VEH52_04015 [Gaiellaceae bacterium]|nr:hypothetical protein [Gaiellaceae bacterium]
MTGLSQHLALLAVITSGVGAAMVRIGLNRRGLEPRRVERRCPACGRTLRAAACEACTR